MLRLHHASGQDFSGHSRHICVGTDRFRCTTWRFVYGQSHLKNAEAVPIDRVELKLSNETYSTVHLKGVFGPLRDASPDYWALGGQHLVRRARLVGDILELSYH
jgi:serine/threonine-protein kinase HipA